jgi:hypothetical protein
VKYAEQAQQLRHDFVPASGAAQTVQGELLRVVGKLRDEAIRHGNRNWDASFESGLRFLERHLLDPAVFSGPLQEQTRVAIARLWEFEHPYVEPDLYDDLSDRVVEYFRHHGSRAIDESAG